MIFLTIYGSLLPLFIIKRMWNEFFFVDFLEVQIAVTNEIRSLRSSMQFATSLLFPVNLLLCLRRLRIQCNQSTILLYQWHYAYYWFESNNTARISCKFRSFAHPVRLTSRSDRSVLNTPPNKTPSSGFNLLSFPLCASTQFSLRDAHRLHCRHSLLFNPVA